MKLFLSLISFLLIFSLQSFAQDQQTGQQQMDPQMKAWMDYMTPGEMHKMLAKDNGSWNTKMTMWMAPGAEPMVSEGTMTNEMILGGRYQKSTFKGNFMDMPMEGISHLAYDNASKEFYSTWIDNMGTGMMISKGKYNEETEVVEMKGTYVDPMSGSEKPFRQTMKVIDDNHQVIEMFMNDETGKEFKNMQIDFTRQ